MPTETCPHRGDTGCIAMVTVMNHCIRNNTSNAMIHDDDKGDNVTHDDDNGDDVNQDYENDDDVIHDGENNDTIVLCKHLKQSN